MNSALPTIELLNIPFTNASKEDILKYVEDFLKQDGEKGYGVTPNPEMIVRSNNDEEVKTILKQAQISLVDGVGVVWAARILGKGKLERFTGVEFVERMSEMSEKKLVKLGFLGGRRGVAERVVKCLKMKYPGMQVAFVNDEWDTQGFANAQRLMQMDSSISSLVADTTPGSSGIMDRADDQRETEFGEKIDILFVAFGFPKQEKWIVEYLPKIPVKIAIGVGGAFDYLSGEIRRAPSWAQAWGLEWMFRLMRQPWRWKRQLALISFVGLVLKEKTHPSNPYEGGV